MSKNIVITGTSRGIGFELAKQFASAGHQVITLARKTDSIQALGLNNITALSCDLASEESVSKTATTIIDTWNAIDIVIHNAGMLVNKAFEEWRGPQEQIDDVCIIGVRFNN